MLYEGHAKYFFSRLDPHLWDGAFDTNLFSFARPITRVAGVTKKV